MFLSPVKAQGTHCRSLCSKDVFSTESSRAIKALPVNVTRLKLALCVFSKVFLAVLGSRSGVAEVVTEVNI
jgi:hypothetical protein